MPSDSFNLAAGMNNPATRREAERLKSAIEDHQAGKISTWTLEQRVRDYTNATNQAKLSEFQGRGGTGRMTAAAKRALSRATKGLGKIGKVLEGVFSNRSQGFQPSQLAAAAELLREYTQQKAMQVAPRGSPACDRCFGVSRMVD